MMAFGLPSILFVVCLVAFVILRKRFRNVLPVGEFVAYKAIKISLKSVILYLKSSNVYKQRSILEHYYVDKGRDIDYSFIKEIRLLSRVVVMFVPLIFYWVLYDQNGTEWQNQHNMLNPYIPHTGYKIQTEQLTVINIILVIIFVPILSYVLYPFLEKRKINISLLQKFNFGFLLMILAFLCSVILQYQINLTDGQLVSNQIDDKQEICTNCLNFIWQLPQWVLLSLSEAILFPVGGQFAYSQVGNQMKASALSLWFLTTSLGNEFVFVFEGVIKDFEVQNRIWSYIIVASIANVVFLILSKYYYVYKMD